MTIDLAAVVGAVQKHLTGKHDQASHAGGNPTALGGGDPKKLAAYFLGAGALDNGDGSWTWNKRGGYAKSKRRALETKLEENGFEYNPAGSRTQSGQADDGVVANTSTWSHPDGYSVGIYEFYGGVKDSNRFSYTFFDKTRRDKHLPGKHDQQSHAGDDARLSKHKEVASAAKELVKASYDQLVRNFVNNGKAKNSADAKEQIYEAAKWNQGVNLKYPLSDVEDVVQANERMQDNFGVLIENVAGVWGDPKTKMPRADTRYSDELRDVTREQLFNMVIDHIITTGNAKRSGRIKAGKDYRGPSPNFKSQTIGDVFVKHLAGKHNQQTHAGGRGDAKIMMDLQDVERPMTEKEVGSMVDHLRGNGTITVVNPYGEKVTLRNQTNAIVTDYKNPYYDAPETGDIYDDESDWDKTKKTFITKRALQGALFEVRQRLQSSPYKDAERALRAIHLTPDREYTLDELHSLAGINRGSTALGGVIEDWVSADELKRGKNGNYYITRSITEKHLPGKHDQQSHAGELSTVVDAMAGKMDSEVWGDAGNYDGVKFSDVVAAVAKTFPDADRDDVREIIDEALDWQTTAGFPTGRAHYEFREGPSMEMEQQSVPEQWIPSADIDWPDLISQIDKRLEQ